MNTQDQRLQLIKNKQRMSKKLLKRFKKIGKKNRQILKMKLKVAVIKEKFIPRIVQPILFYYVGDRLFKFNEQNELVYKPIYNNKLTKVPSQTIIDPDHNFTVFHWSDASSKQGIGHPSYLIEKLRHSSNQKYYQLSELIKSQTKKFQSVNLSPEGIYEWYENDALKDTHKLKYVKTEKDIMKVQKELSTKYKYFMFNHFAIFTNTSDFVQRRKQFSHGISHNLINYFGYTMEEFCTIFLTKGFPKLCNDIIGIDEILSLYYRDIDVNDQIIDRAINQQPARKIPVEFQIRNRGTKTLNLLPQETVIYIISKSVYWCMRSYGIDEAEIKESIKPFSLEEEKTNEEFFQNNQDNYVDSEVDMKKKFIDQMNKYEIKQSKVQINSFVNKPLMVINHKNYSGYSDNSSISLLQQQVLPQPIKNSQMSNPGFIKSYNVKRPIPLSANQFIQPIQQVPLYNNITNSQYSLNQQIPNLSVPQYYYKPNQFQSLQEQQRQQSQYQRNSLLFQPSHQPYTLRSIPQIQQNSNQDYNYLLQKNSEKQQITDSTGTTSQEKLKIKNLEILEIAKLKNMNN